MSFATSKELSHIHSQRKVHMRCVLSQMVTTTALQMGTLTMTPGSVGRGEHNSVLQECFTSPDAWFLVSPQSM